MDCVESVPPPLFKGKELPILDNVSPQPQHNILLSCRTRRSFLYPSHSCLVLHLRAALGEDELTARSEYNLVLNQVLAPREFHISCQSYQTLKELVFDVVAAPAVAGAAEDLSGRARAGDARLGIFCKHMPDDGPGQMWVNLSQEP